MKTLFIFLLIVNTIAFIIVARDKDKARKRLWRTPEKVIFFFAFAGGALGVYLGMILFRHKTKHKKFTIGIPLIILVQLAILYLILTPGLLPFIAIN